MIRSLPLALILVLTSLPATAQTLDRAAARAQLFDADGVGVRVVGQPFLTDADIATLGALPQAATLQYYGALAAPPSEGLQSEATRGAFNYHSIAAARAAARAGCDAARDGGTACAVVAEIVPRGYAPGRGFSLNQDATRAVTTRAFPRAGSDAAIAISRSTGAWGLGDGAAEAIARCAAEGAADCSVAVTR